MANIIELNNIYFSYGETPIFEGLSLSIEAGKTIAFVGHNGSGKSTLAKIIAGLLPISKGKITIENIPLTEKNMSIIRGKIGMVFQNPDNQFLGATVRDDIAFGLENRCVDPKKMDSIIEEYAKEVSMEEYLDREPATLSGGQKQRVAIAGVLAMNPEILIFDEATSMLDIKGKNEVNQLLKKARKDYPSLTMIIITHDLDEALLADKLVLLENGKIVAEGEPKEIFFNVDIEKYSLTYPFALRFSNLANKHGININKVLTEEELEEELWKYYSKK